ncbi:uncharacterized protein LOC134804999 [Cydia splendana]|uniref:uncharacterized protein LOC134804999 n=1 Tax=Cydia splendana TaxID=1100963 RepID=UPI0028F4B841
MFLCHTNCKSYEPASLLQIKMVRGLFVIALVLLAAAVVQSQNQWLERRAINALLHLDRADAQAQAAARAYAEATAEATSRAEAYARAIATMAQDRQYRRQTNVRILLASR